MRSVPRTRSRAGLRGSTRASLSEARRARGFLRSSRGVAGRPATAHFATPAARAGHVERRAEHLRSRLLTWPNRPNGDFLMRRIKDAFDPAGILEPGRSAFA